MNTNNAIVNQAVQKISFKKPAFSAEQIKKLSKSLSNCSDYLSELNIIELQKFSKDTDKLFNELKNNTTIYTLNLTGSYVNDNAMDALIGLLDKSDTSNKSMIENLIVDGVIASPQAWIKFADAAKSFKLRKLSMQGLRDSSYCENLEYRSLAIDSISESFIFSLNEKRNFELDLSGNHMINKDYISMLKEATLNSVIIIFEKTWTFPTWASFGIIGTGAGIFIGYCMTSNN